MDSQRRQFLRELSALSAACATGALGGVSCRDGSPSPPTDNASGLAGSRALLEAAVDRVLPAQDSLPGALRAGCADFILRALAVERFRTLRRVLEQGLAELDIAAHHDGVSTFSALGPERRDEVLTAVHGIEREGFSGERFMRVLVVLTLEGWLGHPRHGGNRDQVGWRSVGYEHVRWAPSGRSSLGRTRL